jgi:hypothetical protein
MSTIAVFCALGGVAFAAGAIPGAGHVIHSCYQRAQGNLRVVPAGTRCSTSERALAFNQIGRRGPQGAQGPQGQPGQPGTNGQSGTPGQNGTNYTIQTTLQPGQTETGTYSVWGGTSGLMGDAVNYRVPLAAALDSTHVVFNSAATSTHCAGPGHADAGYLCVYETQSAPGASVNPKVFNPDTANSGTLGSSRTGFGISFDATGVAGTWSFGSWAATAP